MITKEKIIKKPKRQAQLFLVWSVICFLVILLLFILGEASKKTIYTNNDVKTIAVSDGETEYIIYDLLTPIGVNNFVIEYTTDDPSIKMSIEDSNNPNNPVKANIQNLFPGLDTCTLRFWQFRNDRLMSIKISAENAAEITINSITVNSTDGLFFFSIPFAIIFYFWGLQVIWLVCLREKAFSSILPTVLLLIITCISSVCFFKIGSMTFTGDMVYHTERVEGLVRAIQTQNIPMRLESNFPYGYGYADGLMYGYTLLMIPAFLYLLGLPLTMAMNLFFIFINFSTVMIAYFSFKYIFKSRLVGIVCSALYVFSLYRITVFLGRGCLGEVCAMAFFPLLIYGYYVLYSDDYKNKNIWVILALGYSGVFQSHAISFELVAFLTFLTCIIFIRKTVQKERFLELLRSLLLTIGLNIWFLVPFLDSYINEDFLVKSIGTKMIQHEGMLWRDMFVFIHNGGLYDEILNRNIRAIGPGVITFVTLFIFVVTMIATYKKKEYMRSLAIYSGILSFVGLICSSYRFPWSFIQSLSPITATIVSSFQFPTRILNVVNILLIVVWGYLIKNISEYISKEKVITYLPLSAILTLAFIQCLSGYKNIKSNGFDQGFAPIYDFSQAYGYVAGGEYLLKGTDIGLPGFSYGIPTHPDNVSIDSYEKGYLSYTLNGVDNNSNEESYLELPLFNYRWYKVFDSNKMHLAIDNGDQNIIRVLLPSGYSGDVVVKYVSPWYWRACEIVSLVSMFYLIIHFNVIVKKRKRY